MTDQIKAVDFLMQGEECTLIEEIKKIISVQKALASCFNCCTCQVGEKIHFT